MEVTNELAYKYWSQYILVPTAVIWSFTTDNKGHM